MFVECLLCLEVCGGFNRAVCWVSWARPSRSPNPVGYWGTGVQKLNQGPSSISPCVHPYYLLSVVYTTPHHIHQSSIRGGTFSAFFTMCLAHNVQSVNTCWMNAVKNGAIWLGFCRESRASLVALMVKNLSIIQETQIQSLGGEDLLEKEMATHSIFLLGKSMDRGAWWLQSLGSQRTWHDLVTAPPFSEP